MVESITHPGIPRSHPEAVSHLSPCLNLPIEGSDDPNSALNREILQQRLRALKSQEIQLTEAELSMGDKALILRLLKFLAPDLRSHSKYARSGNSPDSIDEFVDFATKYIQGLRLNQYSDSIRSEIAELTRPLLLTIKRNKHVGLTPKLTEFISSYLDNVAVVFGTSRASFYQPTDKSVSSDNGSLQARSEISPFKTERDLVQSRIADLIHIYKLQNHSPSHIATQRVTHVLEEVATLPLNMLSTAEQEQYLARVMDILNKLTFASPSQELAALRNHIAFGTATHREDPEYMAPVNQDWIKLRTQLNATRMEYGINSSSIPSAFSADIPDNLLL